MSIQEKIDQLQSQVDSHSRIAEAHFDSVKRLQSELDALKAEAVKKEAVAGQQPFRLWKPEYGQYLHTVSIMTEDMFSTSPSNTHIGRRVIERGLAFQSEADAAEVGRYLVVIGKLANAAKQLNKGKEWSCIGDYWCVAVWGKEIEADMFNGTHMHWVRFTCREDAETALGLLTEQERSVLVRGIS